MKRWAIGSGLLAVFILVQWLMTFVPGTIALDATASQRHTLSAATLAVLKNLEDPVRITLYETPDLFVEVPQMAAISGEVHHLLEALENAGSGRIRVDRVNPEPFTPEEDQAISTGISSLPLGNGTNAYFGLDIHPETPDPDSITSTIAFIHPNRRAYLEYDIVRTLAQSLKNRRPTLGLISSLPLLGSAAFGGADAQNNGFEVFRQAQDLFDVVSLFNAQDLLTIDPDVLLVVHPTGLTEEILYAIDQYALSGKTLIIAADPSFLAPPSRFGPSAPTDSTDQANAILKAWGVSIEPRTVVVDQRLAVQVQLSDSNGTPRAPQSFIAWWRPQISREAINSPPLAEIEHLLFAAPGVITQASSTSSTSSTPSTSTSDAPVSADDSIAPPSPVDPGPILFDSLPASTTVTPLLVSTSTSAMVIGADQIDQPDPAALLSDFLASGHAYPIAVQIGGEGSSAFDGPPPPEPTDAFQAPTTDTPPTENADAASPNPAEPLSWPPHQKRSSSPLQVILFADVDFLQDRFWGNRTSLLGSQFFVPNNHNGNLLLSLLEAAAGDFSLTTLRARTQATRPLTVFDNMNTDAEIRLRGQEQALRQRISEIERQLATSQAITDTLGSTDPQSALPVPPAEQQTSSVNEVMTEELLQTRSALRAITRALREDVEQLQAFLRLTNVGVIPALLILLMLVRTGMTSRKSRR